MHINYKPKYNSFMTALLLDILRIPSPTFHEEKKIEFIQDWLQKNAIKGTLTRHNNNLIYERPS